MVLDPGGQIFYLQSVPTVRRPIDPEIATEALTSRGYTLCALPKGRHFPLIKILRQHLVDSPLGTGRKGKQAVEIFFARREGKEDLFCLFLFRGYKHMISPPPMIVDGEIRESPISIIDVAWLAPYNMATQKWEGFGSFPDADMLSDTARERVRMLKADAARLDVTFQYHGEQGKPFYKLVLHCKEAKVQSSTFSLEASLDKPQANRLIDHLAVDGFLENASNIACKKIKHPQGPAYTLTVAGAKEMVLYEVLGWGPPMLERLDAFADILEGDAADKMNRLIGRMSGYRKADGQ